MLYPQRGHLGGLFLSKRQGLLLHQRIKTSHNTRDVFTCADFPGLVD